MQKTQFIQYRFPVVRSKLQNLFPFDPKYDIQIHYKNNKYELQLAYLRLESLYFKNLNNNVSKIIKIQQNLNVECFQQIMKCFYGGTFQCSFKLVFQVWKIIDYLKIESFRKITINSVKSNIKKFDIFQLLAFSYSNNIEQLFNHCLSILENQNYIQLKSNKNQFLKCPLQVFKLLLNEQKRKNKQKNIISYLQINSLLKEYSKLNNYSEQFYTILKFQLIQKTELSSQQYKQIFIEGGSGSTISDMNNSFQNLPMYSHIEFKNTKKSSSDEYQKNWKLNLGDLKNSFHINKNDSCNLKTSIQSLIKNFQQNNLSLKSKQFSLTQMEKNLRQIQKQILNKSQNIKKIFQRVNKLQNNKLNKNIKNTQKQYNEQQQEDVFVQSHIIPGFMIGDMMSQNNNLKNQNIKKKTQQINIIQTNFKSNKKQLQQQKQLNIDNSYKQTLIFDQLPFSIPRRYLSNLAKILDTDKFMKKKIINLIYRRSKNGNIGDSSSIKERNGLLVLLQTQSKKYVGGYISVQIPHNLKIQNICDYQSFLFSLTSNIKMGIRKGQQSLAISLSKHYLLSFGNDLMISNDCLNEDSYCEWPSLYQVPKFSKCNTARDFVGGNQFKISQIQIYEVKNQQIQMII